MLKKPIFLMTVIVLTITMMLCITACSDSSDGSFVLDNFNNTDNLDNSAGLGGSDDYDDLESHIEEGVYVRTEKESDCTLTYTMTLSEGEITKVLELYNNHDNSYSKGEPSSGTYEFGDNMIYVTWYNGNRDSYIFNNTEGSLTHSVEGWKFYR